ncbi:hypothetical protein HK100_012188 [Physocladia obscura]|uniref:SAM domain-containing protein n=1 Tax=Physocladia obscura TaxID=109957 RepID=A0AAD5T035_9FUNG|nr:hypothetical protein HK100_012188 [Physocladia obscura]
MQSCAEDLAQKADGVFIYAALACDELNAQMASLMQTRNEASSEDLSFLIGEYEGNMDDLYISALIRAFKDADESKIQWFQRVVGVLLTAIKPLDQDTIASFLQVESFVVGAMIMQIRSILKISDNGLITVLHKSLKDILTSPARCSDLRFLIVTDEIHLILCRACLASISLGVSAMDTKLLQNNILEPALIYSCRYWVNHALKTPSHAAIKYFGNVSKWSDSQVIAFIEELDVSKELNVKFLENLIDGAVFSTLTNKDFGEMGIGATDCMKIFRGLRALQSLNTVSQMKINVKHPMLRVQYSTDRNIKNDTMQNRNL